MDVPPSAQAAPSLRLSPENPTDASLLAFSKVWGAFQNLRQPILA